MPTGIIYQISASTSVPSNATGIIYEIKVNTATASSATGTIYEIGVSATSDIPPVANAGANLTDVEPYDTITLEGAGSSFTTPDTDVNYAWTQTGGPTVTPTGADTATPTFKAPGTLAGTTLTFALVVTGNVSGLVSSADTMTIDVLPVTERAVIGGVELPVEVRYA